MKLTKDLVGKTIYGYPTGNNRTRGAEEQKLEEFVVLKVARKYFMLKRANREWDDGENYCPVTGATQSAINSGYCNNAGYNFFLSLEEVEVWRDKQVLVSEVGRLMRNTYDRQLMNLSSEGLSTIKLLLEEQ